MTGWSRELALAATFIALVCAGVVFSPVPDGTRLSGTLHDLGHIVVFGGAGFALARVARLIGWPAGRATIALAAAAMGLALGIMTEWGQEANGGSLSWGDVGRDLVGAAGGTLFALTRASRRAAPSHAARPRPAVRAALLAGTALALAVGVVPVVEAVLAYRARDARFPALLDPSSARGVAFLTRRGPRLQRVAVPAAWRRSAGESAVEMPLDAGPYPGLTLLEPTPDWSGYRMLEVDVLNPGQQRLVLQLRLDDRPGVPERQRYRASFELPAATRTLLRIPLAGIVTSAPARRLDLTHVDRLLLYHDGPLPGGVLLLCGLHLTR